jgi:hypothetical protein
MDTVVLPEGIYAFQVTYRNRDDSNPAAAVVGSSHPSPRRSKRPQGTIGRPLTPYCLVRRLLGVKAGARQGVALREAYVCDIRRLPAV